MKAAVVTSACKLEIKDIPMPEVGDNEVLIRNKVCAICNATDTKLFKGTHAAIQYPAVIGHESSGIIEAVGKNVKDLRIGDRVLGGSYPASDSLASIWGQYSEYGIKTASEVIMIPANVSYEQASCSHMLAEALNAVKIGEITPGDNIMIIGAGAVGLSLLTILKHTFPATVVMVDILEEKLKIAKTLGADFVMNASDPQLQDKIAEVTSGKGINKLYEAVGSAATYNLAFDLIAYGGKLMGFGLIEKELEIPFKKLSRKEIQFRWCSAAGKEPKENRKIILNMMHKGLIDVNALITDKIPMERLTDGFESISKGKQIRVMVEL